MSDKKEIQQPGLDTEQAKELELDEQPKPTRNHKGGGAGMGLDGPALSCPGGRKRLVQLGSELSCTIIHSTLVRK